MSVGKNRAWSGKPSSDCLHALHGLLDGLRHETDVAHLSPAAGFAFPVEMEFRHRVREDVLPVGVAIFPEVAEQIEHDDWLENVWCP